MKKKVELREQARKLRAEGKSVREIKRVLNISTGSASSWTQDVVLPPDKIEELEKRNPSSKKFTGSRSKAREAIASNARKARLISQNLGREEVESFNLHLAGCMLYWAEGAKDKNAIRMTNYDPKMLEFFIGFLRQCYNLTDNKFSIYIVIYDETKKDQTEKFWLNLLKLPETCLRKTRICDSKPLKKANRHENGGCTLTVNSTDLVQRLFGSIKQYIGIDDSLLWLY